MERQHIIFSNNLGEALAEAVGSDNSIFILTDQNTHQLCLPLLAGISCINGAHEIIIDAGDTAKTLDSCDHVWSQLGAQGATRRSLMINLGGGMVTDLGGFAASTFKRGISFINIPTTLLAMVDASVGGKTGVNFGGLKNEIGVFRNARCVIIDTNFLSTMDRDNLLSGYAEMLKHGLISNLPTWAALLNFDIEHPNLKELQRMVEESVEVKQRIVMEDPHEHGLRKALNLGHTLGHAIESLAMEQQRPMLHGKAVAFGLMGELYLSTVKRGFPADRMRQTATFIRTHYGQPSFTCDDYPRLLELMTHDKKNTGNGINFTMLSNIGSIDINQTATQAEIEEALDFIREA